MATDRVNPEIRSKQVLSMDLLRDLIFQRVLDEMRDTLRGIYRENGVFDRAFPIGWGGIEAVAGTVSSSGSTLTFTANVVEDVIFVGSRVWAGGQGPFLVTNTAGEPTQCVVTPTPSPALSGAAAVVTGNTEFGFSLGDGPGIGKIAVTGTAVVGTGTSFSSQLVAGDRIYVFGKGFARVKSVEDDTHLTLVSAPGNTTGAGFWCYCSLYAADGAGSLLTVPPEDARMSNRIKLVNAATGGVYQIALQTARRPAAFSGAPSIEANPRTGRLEYRSFVETIGRIGRPTAVELIGSPTQVRLRVTNVAADPSIIAENTRAWIWCTKPSTATFSDAVQLVSVVNAGGQWVAYAGTGSRRWLGQTVPSTDPNDYRVLLEGPTVARDSNRDLTKPLALTGTVSVTNNVNGTSVLSGSNTDFLTELRVGDTVLVGGVARNVLIVASGVSVTLDGRVDKQVTDEVAFRVPGLYLGTITEGTQARSTAAQRVSLFSAVEFSQLVRRDQHGRAKLRVRADSSDADEPQVSVEDSGGTTVWKVDEDGDMTGKSFTGQSVSLTGALEAATGNFTDPAGITALYASINSILAEALRMYLDGAAWDELDPGAGGADWVFIGEFATSPSAKKIRLYHSSTYYAGALTFAITINAYPTSTEDDPILWNKDSNAFKSSRFLFTLDGEFVMQGRRAGAGTWDDTGWNADPAQDVSSFSSNDITALRKMVSPAYQWPNNKSRTYRRGPNFFQANTAGSWDRDIDTAVSNKRAGWVAAGLTVAGSLQGSIDLPISATLTRLRVYGKASSSTIDGKLRKFNLSTGEYDATVTTFSISTSPAGGYAEVSGTVTVAADQVLVVEMTPNAAGDFIAGVEFDLRGVAVEEFLG